MESSHQIDFHILNSKILFKAMFNMNMFFYFVTIVFNKPMFKISISRIHWNTSQGHNLQDMLHEDKILDFLNFEVNGALKCICKLSFFSYYYQNASNFSYKSMKEHNIHQSISSVLITYFYYTKVFQILYSIRHKLNRSINIFIRKLLNDLSLFSYVYCEIFHI